MGTERPHYAIRGKVDGDVDKETIAGYMAQVISGVIGLAILSGKPFIAGKPRESWRRMDWKRLHEDGTMEERLRELIMQEDIAELRRTFNLSLTVATNSLVAMHQMDFLAALGSVMANVLATEGGADEYLNPATASSGRRGR